MPSIEVERRFLVTEEVKSAIQSLETTQTYQKTFQDTYFDTLNFSLYLNDYWLRSRDTCWELKYPLLNPCSSSGSGTLQYQEATTDEEILRGLSRVLKVSTSVSSVKDFVEDNDLKPFACYKTHRTSLKHGDFNIDIDDTNFGFRVGEIEVMVDSTEEVEGAVKRIEDFGKKLGISLKEKIPGKMDEYLKIHDKELYSKLSAIVPGKSTS